MKKIIYITMLMVSIISSQDTPKTQSSINIKLSSLSTGFLRKYVIARYDMADQYLIKTRGGSVYTSFMKIGFSISNKTEIEFYKMQTEIDFPLNRLYNYGMVEGSYEIKKDHFGVSLQYEITTQIYINLGYTTIYRGFLESSYIIDRDMRDSDIRLNQLPQLFGGIIYKLPIYKGYYLPIGIHSFITIDHPESAHLASISIGIGKK